MDRWLGDRKISTKIVACLIVLAAVGLAGVGYVCNQMKASNAAYVDLTNSRTAALINMIRVNRGLQQVGYLSYKVMAYEGGSRQAQEAAQAAATTGRQVLTVFDEANQQAPAYRSALEPFRPRLQSIVDKSARSVALGLKNDEAGARAINLGLDEEIAAL